MLTMPWKILECECKSAQLIAHGLIPLHCLEQQRERGCTGRNASKQATRKVSNAVTTVKSACMGRDSAHRETASTGSAREHTPSY